MTDDRDFVAEMTEAIESAIPDGDYIAALVADDLVAKLRANDPDLLARYLDLRAVQIVADLLARHSNSLRSQQIHRAGSRTFAAAVAAHEGGEPLAVLAVEYVVDKANTRRRVADMTADDHRFVAEGYERTATGARMQAAFHRAVIRKIGKRTTGAVFSEEQYVVLYRSIVNREEPPTQERLAS